MQSVSRPVFELMSPWLFPTMITITPRPPPKRSVYTFGNSFYRLLLIFCPHLLLKTSPNHYTATAKFDCWYRVFGELFSPTLLQTWFRQLWPNNSVLVSSVHNTLSQNEFSFSYAILRISTLHFYVVSLGVLPFIRDILPTHFAEKHSQIIKLSLLNLTVLSFFVFL